MSSLAMASSRASSSSSTARMRVYNRRPNMTSAQESDWANLPSSLLEKVFRSLELQDLNSAKETCRKWKEQAEASSRSRIRGPTVLLPNPTPSMIRAAEWWMDEINSTLQRLREIPDIPQNEALIEIMLEFLVQEGIIQAP